MSKVNLNEIDFKSLEEIIGKAFGYFVKFEVSIEVKRNSKEEYLSVQSQNLSEHSGVMQSVYKSLHISNFGGGLVGGGSEYCLPLNFSFEYKRGGFNGAQFLTAWWVFGKNIWSVMDESDGATIA